MAVTANNPTAGNVRIPSAQNGAGVKKARKSAPADESKAAKWKRLVNFRGAKAIKLLRQIGNLSSRISYEYSDDDAKKLVDTMRREVESLHNRFTQRVAQDAPASIV